MTLDMEDRISGGAPEGAEGALGAALPRVGFDERILRRLREDGVGMDKVDTRPGGGGRDLAYLSAEVVIGRANDIYGPDGWHTEITYRSQTAWHGPHPTNPSAGDVLIGYACAVGVKVTIFDRNGHPIYAEDDGASVANFVVADDDDGKRLLAPNIQMEVLGNAQKGAVSDGIKRALRKFGDPFGLVLYDTEKARQIAREVKSGKHKSGASGGANSGYSGAANNGGGGIGPRVDIACPEHGPGRVRGPNKRGYFCATPVGKDANNETVFCDKKPVKINGSQPAVPAASGGTDDSARGARSANRGGFALSPEREAQRASLKCPDHGAGKWIWASRYDSGFYCARTLESGEQCGKRDLQPVSLLGDDSISYKDTAMHEWDGIAGRGDPEREALVEEFYEIMTTGFGPNYDTRAKVDQALRERGESVDTLETDAIRARVAGMRVKIGRRREGAGAAGS